MNKKKLVKLLLQVVIYGAVAAFIAITVKNNIAEIQHYRIANVTLLGLSVLIYALAVAVNTFAWDYLMRASGEKIPRLESMNVYISSYIVRYIPGNVVAIIARAVLNKNHGVKMIKTAWGWLIENVSFLLVGLFFAVPALLQGVGFKSNLGLSVIIALPICALFVLRFEWLGKLFNIIVKKRLPDAVKNETAHIELNIKQKLTLIGIYAISWVVYSIHFIVLAHAISGIGYDKFIVLASVNALAWSIGYISLVTPSGTGVREAVMIFSLKALKLASAIDAIVISLLARLCFVLGEVLFFGVFKLTYLILNRNHGKQKKG